MQKLPIDRDALLVPEVMIDRFDINPAEFMRPIFDAVWNATGFPRSMNYDESGKWVAHQVPAPVLVSHQSWQPLMVHILR